MTGVTAVVIGGEPEHPRAERVSEVMSAGSLSAIRDVARSARSPLVWLLDAQARPTGGALGRLMEHSHAPAVSLPVDAAGVAVEDRIGRVAEDVHGILEAAERRTAPLRHTHVVSLLVARELVVELAPPDPVRFGAYAGEEWTARLFSLRRGLLVPASRVEVTAPKPGSPRHVLRVARRSGWGPGETVRELARAARRGR